MQVMNADQKPLAYRSFEQDNLVFCAANSLSDWAYFIAVLRSNDK
jgi:hypothetical protein